MTMSRFLPTLAIAFLLFAYPTAAETTQTKIVSWNAYSKQFIDPPEFHLLPIVGTKTFRAVLTQNGHEWRVQSDRSEISLASVWSELATKKFSVVFEWVDAGGKILATEPASVRVKA